MRILLSLLLLLPLTLHAADRVVRLSVPDMSCPACPLTVKKSLQRLSGVTVRSVDLGSKTAVVTVADSVEDADLIKATTEAGYPSTVMTGDSK